MFDLKNSAAEAHQMLIEANAEKWSFNAWPYIALVEKQTVLDLQWEIFPHPACCPDLVPPD